MILTAIGALAGLGTAIYGGIKESQAAEEEKRLMAEQKAADEAWYNRNYYRDYLNTVEAQNAMKRYRDAIAEQTREARARQVISGGTPEQAQAVAEAGAEGYGNLVGNLAAQGEASKQAVDAQKLAMDANLNAQGMAMAQKQQQAGANLVNNGIGTMASSLQSLELPQKTNVELPKMVQADTSHVVSSSVLDSAGLPKAIQPLGAAQMEYYDAVKAAYSKHAKKGVNY